jgi:hypothetical protein
MKLKVQMEKQRAYAIRKIKEATTIEEKQYWIGVRDAMDWAPDSRTEWKYIDGEVMPEEEKFDW